MMNKLKKTRNMKKKNFALLVVTMLTLIVSIMGCSGDIILESENDLIGVYEGTYTITENFGSNLADINSQPIIWQFTDSTYIMKIDTLEVFDPSFSICRVNGRYLLSANLNLAELNSIPDEDAGFNACKTKTSPKGIFTLTRTSNDARIILKQFDENDNIFKEIDIIRK